jgi:deferrochelatase/peroxidase EfeB
VPNPVGDDAAALSRRGMLAGSLGLVSAAALTACTSKSADAGTARVAARQGRAASSSASAAPGTGQQSEPAAADMVAFHGITQAGITTPAQGYVVFAAIDVATGRTGFRALLEDWTHAAAALCVGSPVPAGIGMTDYVDSGEASGAPANRLTVTIGYGPALFDGRFGLAARRPAALATLPRFQTDNLDPAYCGGDLALQICADDAQIAYHAYRQLLRIAAGRARTRWFQNGFRGPQLGTAAKPLTRNLFGFHDGVQNPALDDPKALDASIWVPGAASPSWMRRGTYLVVRRILMFTDGWDDVPDTEQEAIFGRLKGSGAPLSGGSLTSALDLNKTAADGARSIPADAHVRLAAASSNNGAVLLRRSYAFLDQTATGPQAGQLFCAFQNDPRAAFIPIQKRLAASDALNTHTQHVGSAVFACPPGISAGQTWASTLFDG